VTPRTPRAAVVLAALAALATAAGCTGYSGTQSHQVSQWASQYTVISNDQTVVADIDAIKHSWQAGRLKDVTSNCAGLVDDAGTAYGNLPTPDNTLTNELATAYQDFANAGSSCATAASIDSHKIVAALNRIGKGLGALSRATRRLAAEGVH
jgi:hypothetical protein